MPTIGEEVCKAFSPIFAKLSNNRGTEAVIVSGKKGKETKKKEKEQDKQRKKNKKVGKGTKNVDKSGKKRSTTDEEPQTHQPEVAGSAAQLHREQESRAMEKSRLDNQIGVALSNGTGILRLWEQMEKCIETGNVIQFQSYGTSFLEKVSRMNALVDRYRDIGPLPTATEGDPLTQRLKLPLQFEADVETVNKKAGTLNASHILEKEGLDARQLQEWYRNTF